MFKIFIRTVKLSDSEQKHMGALTRQQCQTEIDQKALQTSLLSNNERERLHSAIEAQEDLLEQMSVADEHRRF